MKSFFVLITCIAIVTLPALAQRWEWLYPRPTGNDLYDVQFLSENVGWVAGRFGTLLKTTDGGLTWDWQDVPTGDAISQISFPDEQNGWLLAGPANWYSHVAHKVLHTSDGTNWEEQLNNDTTDLNAIFFSDHLNGCCVGATHAAHRALIYHTRDGGVYWDQTIIDTLGELYAVQFVDAQRGWIAGTSGLLHTTDGGQSWQPIRPLGFDRIYCLSFCDTLHGWIAGAWLDNTGHARLLRTTDGGLSWNLLFGTATDFNRIEFADPWTGCALVNGGQRICRTTDGGLSWDSVYADLRLNDLAIYGDRAWTVGAGGLIARSMNRGYSWDVLNATARQNFDVITGTGPQNLWVVDNDRNVARSTDGGNTWATQFIDSTTRMNDIYFADDSCGWAISDSKIYRTINNGLTWIAMYYESWYTLHFVFALDSQYAYACGEEDDPYSYIWGHILGTEVGGRAWWDRAIHSQPFGQVIYYDRSFGWAVTTNGSRVFRTLDGGNNWQDEGGEHYYYLVPTSSDHLWAVSGRFDGRRGLFSLNDGGWTWLAYDTVSVFEALNFNRNNVGIAAGSGVYAYTSDNGSTWTTRPLHAEVNDVVVAANGEAWGVGKGKTVLHFIPPWLDSALPRENAVPDRFTMSISPNPFNPAAILSYTLLHRSRVQLRVFDVLGREVRDQDLSWQDAGTHTIRFDGSALASGVYFASLRAGNLTTTQKMLLLR